MNDSNILRTIDGGGRFVIRYRTVARFKGRGCPYAKGSVMKTTEMTVDVTGRSYADLVNDVATKGTFKSAPLPWGHWKAGYENMVIEHNGKLYLRMYPVAGYPIDTQYEIDGVPVRKGSSTWNELEQWLDKSSSSAPKNLEEFGIPADKAVRPLSIGFASIEDIVEE